MPAIAAAPVPPGTSFHGQVGPISEFLAIFLAARKTVMLHVFSKDAMVPP